MKKRILSLALVVVMVALVAAGSLAYFTDETDPITNTMTIGEGVTISVSEHYFKFAEGADETNPQQGSWVKFENGNTMPLYPVDRDDVDARIATGQLWNKYVMTKNEGKTPVYIRTIIAVEHIDSANEWKSAVGVDFATDKCDYNSNPIVAKIGNTTYDVYVCTAEKGLAVEGGKSLTSLTSVYLYDDVTYDEVKNAEDVSILVLSQGIQSAGLTHVEAMAALGEITAENVADLFTTNTTGDATIDAPTE